MPAIITDIVLYHLLLLDTHRLPTPTKKEAAWQQKEEGRRESFIIITTTTNTTTTTLTIRHNPARKNTSLVGAALTH